MANYSTFVVIDCYSRKTILVTSSARLANAELKKGARVEVWDANQKADVVYWSDRAHKNGNPLSRYIAMEKEYIAQKQKRAEERNRLKKKKRGVQLGR